MHKDQVKDDGDVNDIQRELEQGRFHRHPGLRKDDGIDEAAQDDYR